MANTLLNKCQGSTEQDSKKPVAAAPMSFRNILRATNMQPTRGSEENCFSAFPRPSRIACSLKRGRKYTSPLRRTGPWRFQSSRELMCRMLASNRSMLWGQVIGPMTLDIYSSCLNITWPCSPWNSKVSNRGLEHIRCFRSPAKTRCPELNMSIIVS